MHWELFCFFVILFASCGHGNELLASRQNAFISELNSLDLSWTAGDTFKRPLDMPEMKRMAGTILRKPRLPYKTFNTTLMAKQIPSSFDLRKQYPYCPSLSWVIEQSNCGSCYAIASASALSDRLCIASGGKRNIKVSAESIISCCKSCGNGCHGGYIDKVWLHFKKEGDITGGEYNSKEGCQPYSIVPCGREGEPKCLEDETETPSCKNYCTNPHYSMPYKHEQYHSRSAYSLKRNIAEIQREIMTYGSVVTGFNVYSDFYYYKSGVYQYTKGKNTGGHAVRIIGWGEENGIPYWLAVNSWGKTWGENGLFKIRRGNNECGFEKFMVAGEAKV